MKIIDLLNKIANGEEVPKKVKYKTYYWEYKEELKDYKDNEGDYVFCCYNYDIPEILNNEVEILEEEKKIPEKLDYFKSEEQLYNMSKIILFNDIVDKLNEIIDYLGYLKRKGDE